MKLLRKLDAFTEPNWSGELVFNARLFGLVIAAFAGLSLFSTVTRVTGDGAGDGAPAKLYVLVGAALPQLLAFVGGVRLFLGDPRGKRSLVYAIALGAAYAVNAMVSTPAGPCGDGPGICEAAKLIGLLMAIPLVAGAAATLYAFVGALGYRAPAGASEKAFSIMLTVFACVGVLAYASAVLA